MSDLLNNSEQAGIFVLVLMYFLYGAVSSLHCVTMCGPLLMISGAKKKTRWVYQIGRLIGYLIIGIMFYLFGKNVIFKLFKNSDSWMMFFKVLVSLLFFGIVLYLIKKYFLKESIKKINIKVFQLKSVFLKSFLLGLFSVFLPCGVLYLMIFSLSTFSQNIFIPLSLIFSFWLGTLLLMQFGLGKVQELLNRFLPKKIIPLMLIFSTIIVFMRIPKTSVGDKTVIEEVKSCH